MIEEDAKCEHGPLTISRLDPDIAVKALDDLLGDDQAETDATRVHAACVSDLAKEFEQPHPVLSLDSDAAIDN